MHFAESPDRCSPITKRADPYTVYRCEKIRRIFRFRLPSIDVLRMALPPYCSPLVNRQHPEFAGAREGRPDASMARATSLPRPPQFGQAAPRRNLFGNPSAILLYGKGGSRPLIDLVPRGRLFPTASGHNVTVYLPNTFPKTRESCSFGGSRLVRLVADLRPD